MSEQVRIARIEDAGAKVRTFRNAAPDATIKRGYLVPVIYVLEDGRRLPGELRCESRKDADHLRVDLPLPVTNLRAIVADGMLVGTVPSTPVPQGPFDQWTTSCPVCGGDSLYVVAITLSATGRRMRIHEALHSDGFIVPVDNDRYRDQSTENEKICCDRCRSIFTLDDLALGNVYPALPA